MIRIYDQYLNFIGEADDFKSCIINRKYRGIETLEMTIPKSSVNASLLKKFNIIYAGPKKIFEILHRQLIDTDGDMLSIVAFGFAKTLSKRITFPPTGQFEDVQTGSLDKIAKAYINNNIINPVDEKRKIAYIDIAADKAGTSYTDRTRYLNLYDEVTRVLKSEDIGYFFELTGNKIIFDTYNGTNRTVSQSLISPVIFSRRYDNITSHTFIDSVSDAANQVIVGGQGEGELRTILEVGGYEGVERFESFVDAKDALTEAEMTLRGLSEQRIGIASFDAVINPDSNVKYQIDYDLGDLITLQYKDDIWISLDTRITEVKEIYQQGQAPRIEIVYGDKYPSVLNNIKGISQRLNQNTNR